MEEQKYIAYIEHNYKFTVSYENIARHTVQTIVSRPNPEQWLMVHTSDLIMIKKIKYAYSHNHHKING